jgi:hypothetical protein
VLGSVAGWIILGTTMLMFSFVIALFPKQLPRSGPSGASSLSEPGSPTDTKQLPHEEQPLTKAILSRFTPSDPLSSKHEDTLRVQEASVKKADGMAFTGLFDVMGPLTLREEHKLRVFENRLLRRIFGPKRDGVTGGWRKLHNEELHNLYSSPSIIRIIKSRRMRWTGHVARMVEERNMYRLLVGKPKVKRPLGRPRRRWIDNIKMGLLEIGVTVVD